MAHEYHDRAAFASGAQQIDDWFHTQAGQASRKGIATVHVMGDTITDAVIGFYTLSNFTVHAGRSPAGDWQSVTGSHPVARASHRSTCGQRAAAGQGIWRLLLFDAVHRAHRMTEHSASLAIVVHALDARAAAWYTRNGFVSFPAHPLSLFIPMRGIMRSFTPLPPMPLRERGSDHCCIMAHSD